MANDNPKLGHYRIERWGSGEPPVQQMVEVRAHVDGTVLLHVSLAGRRIPIHLRPGEARQIAFGLIVSAEKALYPGSV